MQLRNLFHENSLTIYDNEFETTLIQLLFEKIMTHNYEDEVSMKRKTDCMYFFVTVYKKQSKLILKINNK